MNVAAILGALVFLFVAFVFGSVVAFITTYEETLNANLASSEQTEKTMEEAGEVARSLSPQLMLIDAERYRYQFAATSDISSEDAPMLLQEIDRATDTESSLFAHIDGVPTTVLDTDMQAWEESEPLRNFAKDFTEVMTVNLKSKKVVACSPQPMQDKVRSFLDQRTSTPADIAREKRRKEMEKLGTDSGFQTELKACE